MQKAMRSRSFSNILSSLHIYILLTSIFYIHFLHLTDLSDENKLMYEDIRDLNKNLEQEVKGREEPLDWNGYFYLAISYFAIYAYYKSMNNNSLLSVKKKIDKQIITPGT